MGSELGIAIAAGFAGMFGWGLADFFAKKTIDTIGDYLTLAWAGVFGSIVFVFALLYRSAQGIPPRYPTNILSWTLLAFFGALQATVYLFAYKGFGKGQVAVLNPIFASFSGIVALVSILFLGEQVTALRVGVLLVIFAGVMLVSIDPSAFLSRKGSIATVPGFKEILSATLLASVWTLLWKLFVTGKDWLAYAACMFFFMTGAVFIWLWTQKIKTGIGSKNVWLLVALIGVSETVAYLGISIGYSATSLTSVVALLSGAFSIPTIICARLFLGERTTAIQTWGSAVVVLGIALLAFA
ncbi:MAG: DMT family transporter [Patescibacteria group bacterium]|nr:DMT family transporter [Patescibacteria group bacterium]